MLDIIRKRRSIRDYSTKEVSEKMLNQVLEAMQLSPTWKNKQCFEVIVVKDKERQKHIGEIVKHNPCENAYTNATYTLVVIADPSKSGNRDEKPYYMCDSAIAMEHALLCATQLNLGTCWVGVFPEQQLKEYLNIPENYRIVALTPLGYANEEVEARPRRNLDEIVHYNEYKK